MIARELKARSPRFHIVGETGVAFCGHSAPASTWFRSTGPATCKGCLRVQAQLERVARPVPPPPAPVMPMIGSRKVVFRRVEGRAQ